MATNLLEATLRRDRALLIGAISLLFALAGLYTVAGVGMDMTAAEMTRMVGMRDMPGTRTAGDWPMGHAVLVFLMWWVMMVAMMLPSVAPVVLLYGSLLRVSGAAAPVPATCTSFLAGYLAAWAGFSLAATLLQFGLESAGLVSATMMTLTATVPGAMLLIAAGAYQLSPLKGACLSHCRSPAEFIARRRRPGTRGAFVMGLEHGTYCLGCCWALMALLFVGGIMNLYWIVGLAALVALEKLTRIGPTLARLTGFGLLAWGAVILIGAA